MKEMKGLGIGLIVLSGVLWLALPGVPFLPLSSWWKGAVAIILLVIAEIAFWAGSAMVGASVWNRIKNWKIWMWLRKKLSITRKCHREPRS